MCFNTTTRPSVSIHSVFPSVKGQSGQFQECKIQALHKGWIVEYRLSFWMGYIQLVPLLIREVCDYCSEPEVWIDSHKRTLPKYWHSNLAPFPADQQVRRRDIAMQENFPKNLSWQGIHERQLLGQAGKFVKIRGWGF